MRPKYWSGRRSSAQELRRSEELDARSGDRSARRNTVKLISPAQCRMARAGLRLNIRDFARLSGVSGLTVTRFENGNTSCPVDIIRTFQRVLESMGAEFVEDRSGRLGVYVDADSPSGG